jgi:hypothetical protein
MLIRPLLFSAFAILSVCTLRAETPDRAFPAASFNVGEVPAFLRREAVPLSLRSSTDADPSAFGVGIVGGSLAAVEGALARAPSPELFSRDMRQPTTTLLSSATAADAGMPASDDDEEADDAPSRPGTLSPGLTRIPSRFLRTNTVAPHSASPDVSYKVNDKTTIGLFGDMTHTSRTDTRASLAKPERDVGAGVTFQYKFGSH